MKKTLSMLTLIITLMVALSMTAMATDYTISTPEELLDFAKNVTDNESYVTLEHTWTLSKDIDLNDLAGDSAFWPGIGTESNPFQGTFNGAGYTITLGEKDSEVVKYALFSYIGSSATIQNVTVAGEVSSDTTVGGVVTYSDGGTITGCTNTATVTTTDNATTTYTGGIVAYATNASNISGCTNEGDISGSGSVGGVAGYSQTGYTGCTDTGTINGTTPLTSTMFSGVALSYTYTGSAIEPTLTTTLTSDDYSVSYSNNTVVGTATITVTGKGDYSGTVYYSFEIVADTSTDDGDDDIDAMTITLTSSSATISSDGGYYTINSEDSSVTGLTIETDTSNTGIVYTLGITFYVPADTTVTITPVTGGAQ